jgi:hypothetical protein
VDGGLPLFDPLGGITRADAELVAVASAELDRAESTGGDFVVQECLADRPQLAELLNRVKALGLQTRGHDAWSTRDPDADSIESGQLSTAAIRPITHEGQLRVPFSISLTYDREHGMSAARLDWVWPAASRAHAIASAFWLMRLGALDCELIL